MMLSQFLTSMFSICLGLFSLNGQGFPPNPSVALKYAFLLSSYVGELFIYCIGGDIIVSEGLSVANEVYKSGWWMKTRPKLRKSIVLVILRAQKPIEITVGDMLTLNLECFATVVRTAFSFFTFMQAIQNNKRLETSSIK
ncbi:hypothetical protein ILUMI_12067 [Ignelater luminosus]|uniref:Uncharacterized protein n=1 Tax=Ignelater luminosus TaxID=2038154 RepID=A0A8K0G746_IGNLU|nr:hypothetical protein ILUMI_12067 [Ignelater luminosus]